MENHFKMGLSRQESERLLRRRGTEIVRRVREASACPPEQTVETAAEIFRRAQRTMAYMPAQQLTPAMQDTILKQCTEEVLYAGETEQLYHLLEAEMPPDAAEDTAVELHPPIGAGQTIYTVSAEQPAAPVPPAPAQKPNAPQAPSYAQAVRSQVIFDEPVASARTEESAARRTSAARHSLGKKEKAEPKPITGKKRVVLIIICILLWILVLWLLWVLYGVMMQLDGIPDIDLGYTWFNQHCFALF